jgi:hypothetical protein
VFNTLKYQAIHCYHSWESLTSIPCIPSSYSLQKVPLYCLSTTPSHNHSLINEYQPLDPSTPAISSLATWPTLTLWTPSRWVTFIWIPRSLLLWEWLTPDQQSPNSTMEIVLSWKHGSSSLTDTSTWKANALMTSTKSCSPPRTCAETPKNGLYLSSARTWTQRWIQQTVRSWRVGTTSKRSSDKSSPWSRNHS